MASTYDRTKDPNPIRLGTNLRVRAAKVGVRARKGKAITPSDTVDLAKYASGVVCLTTGNLKLLPVENDDADTVTFTGCAVGFVPPFEVRRVFATGTTATVASVDL
jgi:hypothetical protein